MKIKILANELNIVLKRMKAVNKKLTDIEIQKGLLISVADRVTITSNNLESQVEETIDGEIERPGQVVIPEDTVKLLEQIMKDGYLEITENTIVHDTRIISYQSLPANEFVTHELKLPKYQFMVFEKELQELLTCNYAASKDQTRPAITGVNIKGNRFVATNGYFVSVRHGNFNSKESIILTSDLVGTLLKVVGKKSNIALDVNLYDDNLISFRDSNYKVTGRIFDSSHQFLDIDQVFHDCYTTEVILEADKLFDTINFMEKLKSKDQIIIFNIGDELEVESNTPDNVIKDMVYTKEITGKPLKIGFNIKYALAVLKQYKKKEIKMGFTSNVSPLIITAGNKQELLLPVRLKGVNEW